MSERPRQEEIHILKEIAELLNEGTEIKSVLQELLKKLLHVTGFQTGWIFLINEKGKHELIASESLPPALSANQCERMKNHNCWCVNRYRKGELTKASNIIECRRIEKAITEKSGDTAGITHHATVPLMSGEERFGILNVGSPHKSFFEPDELALLESIAFQVGAAVKRIKLTNREQELALIGERNRLARDLHDSVNQLLFSLNLTAGAGKQMAEKVEEKETFQYIQDLAQEALGEMRALIWQLRPSGLENGLIHVFNEYAKMLGLQLHLTISGVARLSQKVEEDLWRIGQEALANVKKHAGVDDIFLDLKVTDSYVMMKVLDKGIGFKYDTSVELPSLGLKSMKHRAENLGGILEIQSSRGEGTAVIVKIPLKKGVGLNG